MLISCPVCGQRHSVNDRYDNSDFICPNTSTGRDPKTFQDMTPTTLLSRARPNFNKHSTKEDVVRPATLINLNPVLNGSGDKIKSSIKKNY